MTRPAIIVNERAQKQSRMLRLPSTSPPSSFTNFHTTFGIIGVHCVCHRFALVLTECIKNELIPPEVVELLRKIYEYFCKSGMRKRNLKKFVKQVNEERKNKRTAQEGLEELNDPDDDLHRIVRLECDRVKLPKKVVLTRWLGCELCNTVMIGGRPAYDLFF